MPAQKKILVTAERRSSASTSAAKAHGAEGGGAVPTNMMQEMTRLRSQLAESEAKVAALMRNSRADALTGLASRATFDEELARSLATARRYGRTHALMMLDVNGQKFFNTQFGRDVGDEVLQHVARILRQNTRSTDVNARFESDCFAVILNEWNIAESAESRAAEIAHTIEATPCVVQGRTLQVNVSFGCRVFGAEDRAADVLKDLSQTLARKLQQG